MTLLELCAHGYNLARGAATRVNSAAAYLVIGALLAAVALGAILGFWFGVLLLALELIVLGVLEAKGDARRRYGFTPAKAGR